MIDTITQALIRIYTLGGGVVMLMMIVSVATLGVVFFKIWQFWNAGVGRHRALSRAIDAWDAGATDTARKELTQSTSFLADVIDLGFETDSNRARLLAEAETRFARLEGGFRFLDNVAQLSPLLGLFGTVLGMISAFQSLQAAGPQVDPSVLAGGIWIALMTTAVGLVVAMPTSLVLSWFETRLDRDRVLADRAISTILSPRASAQAS